MRLIFLTLMPLLIWAQSYLISTIPLPKTYVQNLDPYPCDVQCLQQLVEEEQVFSFLAHAQDRIDDTELNDYRLILISLLNVGSMRDNSQLRIALLLPHRVIGRYAFSTTNAVFAYMLTKNRAFEIRSFQVESESEEDLQNALQTIEADGFYYVIAPVTQQGAETITSISPDLNIYFPTVNKYDVNTTGSNFFFGGIDYRAQIDTLLSEANASLVVFSDNSRLGRQLESYTKEEYAKLLLQEQNSSEANATIPSMTHFTSLDFEEGAPVVEKRPKEVVSYTIDKHTSNLENQLKDNESIQYGNFFLNTPIIKSGMVMSQLTLYDVNVTNILSTQISYDPLILSMTQYHDREKMIIANSIDTNNNVMVETNALLSNDIMYDWINYATTVGADYIYHLVTHSEREYDLPMVDNQILYPVNLVRPSFSRFIPYYSDYGSSTE